jgi:hypothetical protein
MLTREFVLADPANRMALGLVWLTQLHPDSAYATHALPAEILTGLGIGCVFVPVFNIATQGVAPHETGIASAMVNTANQVGGSIGTALLNTIAASATAGYLIAHARGSATAAAAQGLVHGYTVAIAWGAGILAAAALLATIMITAGRPAHPGDNAPPTAAHAPSKQPDPARHPEAGGSDAGSNGYKTPGPRHPPATETAGADELQLRRRRR